MAGHSTGNTEYLTRTNLWSTRIKETLLDELSGMKYVEMITDFPDGDSINIPSIGQATVQDYDENQAIMYTSLDTGNFTFTIDKYQHSAHYITNKLRQDSFYADRLVSEFVPTEARAIAVAMETNLLSKGNSGQTASDPNTINGARHRMVAGGTNQVITVEDFAKAYFALRKANVPLTNLVAIVDPSVVHTLATQPNLINLNMNPRWDGIVSEGSLSGMQFKFNVFGFDVYESNYLPSSISETVSTVAVTNGVANMFFSAAPNVTPFVGLLRQAPTVESEYKKDLQREEYLTICRYGFKLFRPENMVVVLSDTSRVYS